MADQLFLMERNGERMNVPPEKVAAFEADGWKVISRPEAPASVAVETPPLTEHEQEFVESVPLPAEKPKGKKGKS